MNTQELFATPTLEIGENETSTGLFSKLSDLTAFSEYELLRGCCTQGCCSADDLEIGG